MKKTALVSLALLLNISGIMAANATTILDYTDFSSISGLELDGDAYQNGDELRLTDAEAWSMGSAFTSFAVDITSFSASFSFSYSGYGSEYGSADGIVFTIKSVSSGDGEDGGSMGYSGITNSVGVEFDNWYNSEYDDPESRSDHIGIDINGSVSSTAIYEIDPEEFNDDGVWYAWIDYDGTTLSVSISQTDEKPSTPSLTQEIDIVEIVGSSTALIGFTASTGAAYQNQDILSLQYSTGDSSNVNPVPEPSTLVLTGIGGSLIGLMRRKRKSMDKAA